MVIARELDGTVVLATPVPLLFFGTVVLTVLTVVLAAVVTVVAVLVDVVVIARELDGTVVLATPVPLLFFGTVVLTVVTVLVGTVVLLALVGIADTATLNESGATPSAAFATDTLDETHDTINKTNKHRRAHMRPSQCATMGKDNILFIYINGSNSYC